MTKVVSLFELVGAAIENTPYKESYAWEYEISVSGKNNEPLMTLFSDFYTPAFNAQKYFDS